jgi:hypothetical protein
VLTDLWKLELLPQELGGKFQTRAWSRQEEPRTEEDRSATRRCDKGNEHMAADVELEDHPTQCPLSHKSGS